MPSYDFKAEDGTIEEHFFTIAQLDAARQEDGTHLVDGRKMKKCFGLSTRQCGDLWPQESSALGCGPNGGARQRAWDKEHGLDIDYNRRTGKAIIRSMAHKREIMKVHGMVDYDSYY